MAPCSCCYVLVWVFTLLVVFVVVVVTVAADAVSFRMGSHIG